jgi:hypothetical protein
MVVNRKLSAKFWKKCLLSLIAVISFVFISCNPPALAALNDDRFDGNIFALYGGNGSLVPPRITLAESLKNNRPSLLVLYVEDSKDCKQYSTVISQLQAPYGRVVNFLPINVDSIPVKTKYEPNEPGYYYKGFVPQTVILDAQGKVLLNESGKVSFEKIDDVFRPIFNLPPRTEQNTFKERSVNEINVELSQ